MCTLNDMLYPAQVPRPSQIELYVRLTQEARACLTLALKKLDGVPAPHASNAVRAAKIAVTHALKPLLLREEIERAARDPRKRRPPTS